MGVQVTGLAADGIGRKGGLGGSRRRKESCRGRLASWGDGGRGKAYRAEEQGEGEGEGAGAKA